MGHNSLKISMIGMNKSNMSGLFVWLMAAVAALCPLSHTNAQAAWDQEAACPGWNNPLSFVVTDPATGEETDDYYYSGRKATAKEETPNLKTNKLGLTWDGSTISGALMASSTSIESGGYNSCASAPSSSQYKNFYILDSNAAVGTPKNRDPNTGYKLPFVPVQFNTYDTTGLTVNTNLCRSIRVGDACAGAKAGALQYTMYVTPDNAMLFIYYACVIEKPGHGTKGDPAFIIRVLKKNGTNWEQITDTMTYVVSSTPAQGVDGTTQDGTYGTVTFAADDSVGWHKYTPSIGYYAEPVYYKDWAKVALNLTNYMYDEVRIEMMIRDCPYSAHYAYAYVAGECRPMSITDAGCPPGMETDVSTLMAPRGLLGYQWACSEFGWSQNTQWLMGNKKNSHFTFRDLTEEGTEADSAYIYKVQADDFRITKSGNKGEPVVTVDSVGPNQSFRCALRSAIDPNKEFISYLYVNVTNTKPLMSLDSLSLCGGDVRLVNTSHVPGNSSLVDHKQTKWSFYNNPECEGLPDSTAVGDTIWLHYNDHNLRGVRVRTDALTQKLCYSEAIYPILPLPNPGGGMTISPDPHVLCDDAEATLRDTSTNSTSRFWLFRAEGNDENMDLVDTVWKYGDDRQLVRPFTHAVEPVEMWTRNDLFYVDRDTKDTVWCQSLHRDTIRVFLHPELEVIGDTIVCNGTLTDAVVNAVGVDDCTYEWSTSNGAITGNLGTGNRLQVVPYADTATYYVRVTSPQGCVAWDSIRCYLITPKLSMTPADGRICPGDVVVLKGSNANSYTWTASPADSSLAGQDTNSVINVYPQRNTLYTLVGHGGSGDNRCDASPLTAQVTVIPYPVPTVHLDPEIVDSEFPTITLRDDSPYTASRRWIFYGGAEETAREVTHTFDESVGADSVYVTLIPSNELGCSVTYPFSIPVNLFTAWFPNVFTPGSEDENATFHLFTINQYDHFHIFIYNRMGQKVFDSTDPTFVWDGTYDGKPLPQGTYVYVCRFRKPGTYTVSEQRGTITLVR